MPDTRPTYADVAAGRRRPFVFMMPSENTSVPANDLASAVSKSADSVGSFNTRPTMQASNNTFSAEELARIFTPPSCSDCAEREETPSEMPKSGKPEGQKNAVSNEAPIRKQSIFGHTVPGSHRPQSSLPKIRPGHDVPTRSPPRVASIPMSREMMEMDPSPPKRLHVAALDLDDETDGELPTPQQSAQEQTVASADTITAGPTPRLERTGSQSGSLPSLVERYGTPSCPLPSRPGTQQHQMSVKSQTPVDVQKQEIKAKRVAELDKLQAAYESAEKDETPVASPARSTQADGARTEDIAEAAGDGKTEDPYAFKVPEDFEFNYDEDRRHRRRRSSSVSYKSYDSNDPDKYD